VTDDATGIDRLADVSDLSWRAVAKNAAANPWVAIMLVLVGGVLLWHYIVRGIQVVVPVALGLAAFGAIVWLAYASLEFLAENVAIVVGYLGISIAAAVVLAVLGYVADKYGWMEWEDDYDRI